MTRTYDSTGLRKLPTGYERRLPNGVVVQAHCRTDLEWARRVLEEVK